MNNLEIFKGNSLVSSELMQSLLEMNKVMAGGAGIAGKRLSIRGGKFRMIVDGEQVAVSKSDTMNMVILNAAPIARTFYEGAFDAENPSAPTCWSADTQTPASDVPDDQRQAARCTDCPMNVKGSGQGESRACRYSQRLAVALESELETVFQLQLPATSIFGDGKGSDMGLQAYIKFLVGHDAPAVAVLTEMRFDEESATPKLYFRAVRGLEAEELQLALGARESEDAQKALAFTVGQVGGPKPATKPKAPVEAEAPKKAPAVKARAKTKPVEEAEDEDTSEPTKVVKGKTEVLPAKTANKIASIIDAWGDADDED